MRLPLILSVVALVLLTVSPSTPASQCRELAIGTLEFAIGEEVYYLVHAGYQTHNFVWIYQESNGIFVGGDPYADLQRGGSHETFGYWDPCPDWLPPGYLPDTMIY